MIKAILFDFDGTLVDFVDADLQSLRWLHAHTGTGISCDAFLETAVDEIMAFHQLVAEQAIDPLLMHAWRLQNTFARYGLSWDDAYLELYRAKLIEACVPFAGVEPLLEQVRCRVKTGLVTNAYDAQEQRARIVHTGLDRYFDVIVIACEVGSYKPEPDIFWHALAQIGVAPEVALYVGDSLTHDIAGAKAAGMQAVLLSQTPIPTPPADYTVGSIAELHQLLDKVFS